MKAGDTLGGKYKLIQRLGAGAMGVVWEAINLRTERKVALKLINRSTDDLRHRLLREARACGSLNHPNIVEVYDVGETDTNDPFLVMQLLTGETLAEMLERKKRIEPHTLAARIVRDIAAALDAAHSAKIIHRDLKPANILLHREPDADAGAFTVKVLDFGVSKSLATNDGPATVSGMVVGSPAYMSPEQVRMSKGLDHRTDIWSLGIILYEVLTGMRPFGGKTVEEVVHQILNEPIPLVSDRVRSVPQALDELVLRCLERDRDKRIQTAKALARALGTIAEASSISRVMVNVPTAPPSNPARLPMGLTLETAATIEAQATAGSSSDWIPMPTVERPAMGSSPAIVMTESQAITLPRQRPAEVPGGALAAPAGTQLLSPTEPIASPMPAWRLEMQQAIAASRKAAQTQSAPALEDLPQGGTLALAPEKIPGYAAAVGRGPGVTTTTTPLMQPALDGGMLGAPTSEAASRKRKQGVRGWLYIVVAAEVVAVGALAAVVALGFDSNTKEKAAGAAASAAAEHGAAPPVTPASATPTVAESASRTTATATATPEPPATATDAPAQRPSGSAKPPALADVFDGPLVRKPAPSPSGSAKLPGPMPQPWCGKYITTNCRNPIVNPKGI